MNKFFRSLLVLCCILCTFNAAQAGKVSVLKVGKKKYKNIAKVEPIGTGSGDDASVSFTGQKGTGTGTITLILQGLFGTLEEGATYEVTTGQDSEEGKVSVNFSTTKTSRKGTSTILASDEESELVSGSVKVKSLTDQNNFTLLVKAKIKDNQKNVTKLGETESTESRSGAAANIKAVLNVTIQ